MKEKNAGLPISEDPLNLDGVKRSWFDRGGGLNVDKHRYFVIILLLLMLNLGQWWQYNQLFPLKTVRPFRVVENDAGKPVADFSAFKTYTPERADVEKTLRYWAKSLYTILGYKQSLAGLNEAKQLLIGQAISQFTEWLTTEQPAVLAHENPLMSRTVEIASLAVLPDNVAHIRIAVTTRSSDDSPPEVKHLLITLRYIYVRPEKEEDILKSANGVYINFFNVEPDRA